MTLDVRINHFFQFPHSAQVTDDYSAAGHVLARDWPGVKKRKGREGRGGTISDEIISSYVLTLHPPSMDQI